jgi:hypothetical protein
MDVPPLFGDDLKIFQWEIREIPDSAQYMGI